MKILHKGSEEARNELPTLLEGAEGGQLTIITRRGRAVAALVPIAHLRSMEQQKSLLSLRGSGRGLWGKDSGRTLKKLREEWDR
jgi:prevent-host-death family protein